MEGAFAAMRKKELRLVITFNTTTEAIAMESSCKENNIPGRIIPVPTQISAGCGLSWSMPPEWTQKIKDYMKEKRLCYDKMGEYII